MNLIAEGLQFMNANNFFHQDIKPANICVKHTNDRYTIKIIDFGLTKELPVAKAKESTQYVGTLAYMYLRTGRLDLCDIWAYMGCLFLRHVCSFLCLFVFVHCVLSPPADTQQRKQYRRNEQIVAVCIHIPPKRSCSGGAQFVKGLIRKRYRGRQFQKWRKPRPLGL